MMYALFVVPSSAVTLTEMVLVPTTRLMGADAEPLATAAPLTVTVALPFVVVGVMVTLLVALGTAAAYDVVAAAKDGVSVPVEMASAVRVASGLGVLAVPRIPVPRSPQPANVSVPSRQVATSAARDNREWMCFNDSLIGYHSLL